MTKTEREKLLLILNRVLPGDEKIDDDAFQLIAYEIEKFMEKELKCETCYGVTSVEDYD